MGGFDYSDTCWKSNIAKHKPSKRFLEGIDDNFLTLVTEVAIRKGVLLDLILVNKEGLVGDVKDLGNLGYSNVRGSMLVDGASFQYL